MTDVEFFQFRISYLDRDFTVRAVALFVCGRIRDQILRAQLALDLRKRRVQVKLLVRKERTAAGAFREVTQRIAIYAIALTADPDRINHTFSREHTIDRFLLAQDTAG